MIPLLAYCNYFYHPPMKTIKCFALSLPTYYYDIYQPLRTFFSLQIYAHTASLLQLFFSRHEDH